MTLFRNVTKKNLKFFKPFDKKEIFCRNSFPKLNINAFLFKELPEFFKYHGPSERHGCPVLVMFFGIITDRILPSN